MRKRVSSCKPFLMIPENITHGKTQFNKKFPKLVNANTLNKCLLQFGGGK